MVSASLMGTEVEKTEVEVTIQVPDPLYEAITEAAEKTGMDSDLIFQKMASEGFQHSLDEKLLAGKVTTELENSPVQRNRDPQQLLQQLKEAGWDTQGMEGKLGEFKDLMAKLANVKDMMEHAADRINLDEGQDTEDSE